MKTFLLGTVFAVAALFSPAIASAEDGFSATASVTNDYRYRGVSLSQTEPSVGGEFRYDNSLIYLGVGGDSVDLGPFDGPSVRGTAFAGVAPSFNLGEQSFGADFGVEYVSWFGEPTGFADLDYYEFHGGLNTTLWAIDAAATAYYSPDYFNTGNASWTYEGEAGLQLIKGFRLGGTLGQVNLDNTPAPLDTWTYYDVSLNREVYGFDVSVAYVGNDINTATLPGWATNSVDDGFVFTVSRTF